MGYMAVGATGMLFSKPETKNDAKAPALKQAS